MRSYSWRRHNHPFTLSFLEEVLRWVGMNEVHKAITLFLDTLDKQPGSPRTQRWVELPAALTQEASATADGGVCVFDRSLYRELLFLTLAAMGKDHVGTSPLTSDLLQMLLCFSTNVTVSLFLQLLLIRSSRRRTRGSAPRWGGMSCEGSERSLLALKPWTADAASTRRCSAEASRPPAFLTAAGLCCPLVDMKDQSDIREGGA